jgi:hypothetical protein
MDIECAEQPSTDECSADSDENVTDQPESCAPNYERREQSCNESDDQPGEEIHFVHPNDEGLGDAKNVQSPEIRGADILSRAMRLRIPTH